MSISDDNDDHSSTFWPGYVDAVVNLAINLLFVIAVLSIVVLGATLKIANLSKKPVAVAPLESTHSEQAYDDVLQALQRAEKAKTLGEKTLSEKDRLLLSTQSELIEVQVALRDARSKLAQLQTALQDATKPAPVSEAVTGLKTIIRQTASGALVIFGIDQVETNTTETENLLTKLGTLGQVSGNSWRISVVYSKGTADAARIANQRAQSVKNLLIKNGVAPGSIEVRSIETEQATANNARITVSIVR